MSDDKLSDDELTDDKQVNWLWIAAAAFGGCCGILHFLGRHAAGGFGGLDEPVRAVGAASLYLAPIFLGILAGVTRPARAVRTALLLCLLCLVFAGPLMGEGLICLVVVVPAHLVLAPVTAVITGEIVRRRRAAMPGQRPELLLLLVPLGGLLAERLVPTPPPAPVTIEDSVDVAADRASVWRSIEHLHLRLTQPAPWLVRAALPVPLAIVGGGASRGDERRVVFHNGVVVATVTAAEAPETFAIALRVERSGREFFDHFSVLSDSRFHLAALADGRTRVTHTTRYLPLSAPRWYFAPIERALGHVLQRHLLVAYQSALDEERCPACMAAR